ncbi:sigma-54-dependent Fis family transcriptional regulator [Lichenicoccus sp.]|uniref:sigma-54-dependent Fis family transcriptional regulator n=1 Tax=Lichenicoccus sp. TaxID=2781899 RepID=UPI003D0B7BF5
MRGSVDEQLRQARIALERAGIAQTDLVAPEISASWARCLDAGLDPHCPVALEEIDAGELAAAREQSDLVRRLTLAEMQALYNQIAGSNFLIAFADPNGILLDTIADQSFRAAARTANIRAGTLWTERRCGTNALGTVGQIGRALTVHGGEHFFARHGTLTCTAAPIFAPDRKLVGVLDASSHCGTRQQHTRALVGMAATQVENGLFRHAHSRDLVIAFHSRGEYLHTLSAGLLALAPDGTVLGANPQAAFLLQGLPALPGRHFDDLFRTRFATVLDHGRSQEQQRLEDRVGSVMIATIEHLPRPAALPLPVPGREPVRLPAAPRCPVPPGAPAAFVADDPAVLSVLRQVAAGAARGLPILIRGETGTGKEQLARYAHHASGRTGGFVPVNCAALPDTLVEAELFGHAEGAFTGARRGGARGLVCEADGGTLFLDEIGDMPLALQAVLLRLLDDWMVRPVGGGHSRRVDVLLIAATNATLDDAMQSGRFRADLFYRLDAVDVHLPPLRARQDFAAIARRLLADIAPGCTLGDGAIAQLSRRHWTGNIRELRNVLLRLTLTEPERCLDAEAIAPHIAECGATGISAAACNPGSGSAAPLPGRQPTLRDAVRSRIVAAYRDTGGNLSETARRLGVSRNTIYRAIGKSTAPRILQ